MKKMFLMLMLIASCAINAYTQTAEEWIEQAEIAEQEGRWTEAGAARSSAGRVQRENSDYAAAAENFERAAENFKKDGRVGQADIEHGNAAVNHEQAAEKAANKGRNKEAAKHYEEAAEQYEKTGRSGSAEAARIKAKSLQVSHQPGFHIALIGSLPLGNVAPQNVPLESLQSAIFAPSTMELLFERLQGKFFIGDISGQTAQNFEMSGTTQAMPGLRLGHRLGNRFELRAGGHYFQSKWSGNFPVVVFPFEQDPSMPPQTLQGKISASSSAILAETDLSYFFATGTIGPFVHAGIRGQFPTRNEAGATLAGVTIPLETAPLGNSYSAVGGAGIRVGFLKNGFLEANVSYGKVPSGDYAPSVGLSLGWQFGTPQKPGGRPELIDVDNDTCNCGWVSIYDAKFFRKGRVDTAPIEDQVTFSSHTDWGKNKKFQTKDEKGARVGTPATTKENDVIGGSFNNNLISINCTGCSNDRLCEEKNRKVWFKTEGMDNSQADYKEIKLENGAYTIPEGKVQKPADEKNPLPVVIYIMVTYHCHGNGAAINCLQKTDCFEKFRFKIEREKAPEKK
ncbi:MAG: hypothetical protein ACKVT2_07720 [Saprospiraceae bacterium]